SLFFFNFVALFTKNRFGKIFLMIAQNIKKPQLRWIIPIEKLNMSFVRTALGCCQETEDVLKWKNINTPWKYFPLFYNASLSTKSFTAISQKTKFTIGYIGRLSEEKGIDTLLNAYEKLDQTKIELIIAG